LFPNPVVTENGKLFLEIDDAPEEETIQVFDDTGRLVIQYNVEINANNLSILEINVTKLTSGTYTIQAVETGYRSKFIVIR